MEAFTPDEQEVIRKTYKIYCHWCLGWGGNGIPDKHAMKLKTFDVMTKAAKYFGEY